jgi:hypothetical protein
VASLDLRELKITRLLFMIVNQERNHSKHTTVLRWWGERVQGISRVDNHGKDPVVAERSISVCR